LIERTAFSARDEAHAVRERTPTLSVVTSPDSTGPWRTVALVRQGRNSTVYRAVTDGADDAVALEPFDEGGGAAHTTVEMVPVTKSVAASGTP